MLIHFHRGKKKKKNVQLAMVERENYRTKIRGVLERAVQSGNGSVFGIIHLSERIIATPRNVIILL